MKDYSIVSSVSSNEQGPIMRTAYIFQMRQS
jgi:hypothetical protein